jgi:hypothetical protein
MQSSSKMPVVPRTPLSPKRSLSPVSPLSQLSENTAFPIPDVYDRFAEYYFSSDIVVRPLILQRVINFVGHPAYAHLLRTMDKFNAHHVMGYLRSQRNVEMYIILDQITKAAATKSLRSTAGF